MYKRRNSCCFFKNIYFGDISLLDEQSQGVDKAMVQKIEIPHFIYAK